jgi:hypothetical protein
MSNEKFRIKKTQLNNLISNLRGEVGEIITSWVLLRHMMARQRELMSNDIAKDLANQDLVFVNLLEDKLAAEIVGRLSELAEPKIGRLTFHFASTKIANLTKETEAYRAFIKRHKFQKKRNYDISHKELPEEWSQHRHIHIPYRTILRGIGKAVRLMKGFDRIFLGPAAKRLWREMKKRQSILTAPPSVAYMMLPYFRLSRDVRAQIVMEEMAEGRQVWSEMATTINGQKTTIRVCREWGAILLGDQMIVLDEYPLQELQNINFAEPASGGSEVAAVTMKPITNERKITAKFRVIGATDNRISFAPVQRQHPLGNGVMTDLVDIHVNLNEKLRLEFGKLQLGDEREFTLTVTLLEGYEKLPS